jgi:hypothetical protein
MPSRLVPFPAHRTRHSTPLWPCPCRDFATLRLAAATATDPQTRKRAGLRVGVSNRAHIARRARRSSRESWSAFVRQGSTHSTSRRPPPTPTALQSARRFPQCKRRRRRRVARASGKCECCRTAYCAHARNTLFDRGTRACLVAALAASDCACWLLTALRHSASPFLFHPTDTLLGVAADRLFSKDRPQNRIESVDRLCSCAAVCTRRCCCA